MSVLSKRKNDISNWTHRRKLSQFHIVSSIFIAIGFVLSNSLLTQAFPIRSKWRGTAKGQVFNKTFQLPIVVEFNPAVSGENNPFNLRVGIGTNPQEIGHSDMFSALKHVNGAVLQYLTIQASSSKLTAQLDNRHTAAAAAINQFSASNVSAQYAPSIMQHIYASLSATEFFVFNEGSRMVMSLDEHGRLVGKIEGTGSSVIGIFPLPPVNYQASFTLEREQKITKNSTQQPSANLSKSSINEVIDKFADRIFDEKYPELKGRKIRPEEVQLRKEWLKIRECDAEVDYIFYRRHPELEGRRIESRETNLINEWLSIKKSVRGC